MVPLGSSTQYLYASPDYLASADKIELPGHLSSHPYIASQIAIGPASLTLWRGLDDHTVRVAPRVAVRDHEAVLLMALQGLGVALLPGWMAADYASDGRLVKLLPEFRGPAVDFNIVFPPHRAASPNTRAFVDFLTEKFDQNRPWETAQHRPVRVSAT